MGGAVALSVAHKLDVISTSDEELPPPLVILMAPMLQFLNVSLLEHAALQCLAFVAPTAQLIPRSATDAAKQYRDATKRRECEDDTLTVSGSKLCVASALTCVDVKWKLRYKFGHRIDNPFLFLIADEDVVVQNGGSEDFFAQSSSPDKTKKNYPALHGLLCEKSPLFDEIRGDILNWIFQRT
jgi:alpha-beta hydrolase superfamily lysophospholipase